MPIFMRNKTYMLRRRVPKRYAEVEERREIKISLKTDSLEVANIKAAQVWQQQIGMWEAMVRGETDVAKVRYEAAQELAAAAGMQFLHADEVAQLPLKDIYERFTKTLNTEGEMDPRRTRAFLGAIKKPGIRMSEALEIFFELTREEDNNRSRNQLRVRHNNFKRAFKGFIEVAGDIELQHMSADHMLELREFYGQRIQEGHILPGTANKEMKNLGTVLRRVNQMKRLDLDLPLSGWAFKGAKDGVRKPFSTEWIKRTLIKGNHLSGLNSEARAVVHLMINTGVRPSEAGALIAEDIHLGGKVPFIEIKARSEGEFKRAVKTSSAERVIPLTGVSLDALRAFPQGFPRYFDRSSTVSATINKYLRENDLMETEKHSLYCLRHSFEDRMLEASIDERLRRDFLGHALGRERYGSGGDLAFRRAQLERVAL